MTQSEHVEAPAETEVSHPRDGVNGDPFEAAWRMPIRGVRGQPATTMPESQGGAVRDWTRVSGSSSQHWSPPRAGGRWLDAGCGAGTYTRILRGRGLEVVGTDYSLPTLRKAMQRDASPGRTPSQTCVDCRSRPTLRRRCLPWRDAGAVASDDAVHALVAVTRRGGEVWIDGLNRWCVVNLFDPCAVGSRAGGCTSVTNPPLL